MIILKQTKLDKIGKLLGKIKMRDRGEETITFEQKAPLTIESVSDPAIASGLSWSDTASIVEQIIIELNRTRTLRESLPSDEGSQELDARIHNLRESFATAKGLLEEKKSTISIRSKGHTKALHMPNFIKPQKVSR